MDDDHRGKPGRPNAGHVRLTVHVPPGMKQQLRVEAAKRGLTISAIVVEAITNRIAIVVTRGPEEKDR